MVEATVTNDPVSIQLNGASTTVPANETWVVNIGVHGSQVACRLEINGVGQTLAASNTSDPHPPQFRMTLTGGDTVTEVEGRNASMVSIQGFVVDS